MHKLKNQFLFSTNPEVLKFLLIVAFSAINVSASAIEWNDSLRYDVSLAADFSVGKNTPFWFVNNNNGLISTKPENGYGRISLFKDSDPEKRFTWGAGVDLVAGWNQLSPFRVQQLYAEASYRCLDIMVGQKELSGTIRDPKLSSGDLLFSGNARPIPQLRVGIFDYADFWGCKGYFAIKGYVAYGKFTDGKWMKTHTKGSDFHRAENVLYHSKGIWFRFGDSQKFPLTAELGLEMATQFGGTVYKDGNLIKMPTDLKAWLKAFIPLKAENSIVAGENTNIQGNMVGAWDLAFNWTPASDWRLKAYIQHYFEDHSMMFMQYNWNDGLVGVEAKLPSNRFVTKFVYEFLHTKDQSGPVNHDRTPEVTEQNSGRDNYYNHYLYPGWQHWGMGIGNPLLIAPIYNEDGTILFSSSRVVAHHFALTGDPVSSLSYRLMGSFTRSWGTYGIPFQDIATDCMLLAEINWHPEKFKGWQATIGVAGDSGTLLGKSLGIMLKLEKTGFLFGKK